MSIKIDITQNDYAAFVKYVARKVSTTRGEAIVLIFIWITIGLGFGFALSLLNLSAHPTAFPTLVCGAFAGLFFR